MQKIVKATKSHCRYCFETLIAKKAKLGTPAWPSDLEDISAPLFVTWTYTKNEQLRGCIGTFEAGKLSKLLPSFTLTSALKDNRFPPISIDEIEHLSVSVSLLVNFQQGKKAYDWELGKHGIVIEFQEKGTPYDATFLPEVAVEQKWSKEDTLNELVEKAGYNGSLKKVVDKLKVTTYESSQETLSYKQYKQMIQK